jgi:hypothetical protein
MPLTNSYYFLGGNKTETINSYHHSTPYLDSCSLAIPTLIVSDTGYRGIDAV